MTPLPALMVAPNGARRTRADHPALPLTLEQITAEAAACYEAGAEGLHLHLRDHAGQHILDAGMYREALAELARSCPGMAVQITTEAAGKYAPRFQRALATETGAPLVSAAYREITADGDLAAARDMHQRCQDRQIALQYILYTPGDLTGLAGLLGHGTMAAPDLQLLFVLGGHGGHDGAPQMLPGFLERMNALCPAADWMVCAFGVPETDCLRAAWRAGGKLRVGFENSLWHGDGSLAADNAARVAEICRITRQKVTSANASA